MALKLLHKGDEAQRLGAIIDISRSGDVRYVPQLLVRLESDETHENKRHIIRALGNIRDSRADSPLLKLFSQSSGGNILGDLARSLGQLGVHDAIPRLKELESHSNEWVRQNATWALKQMRSQPTK
ncbi:MAG: HEAT repeat domain-containing protein [Planctomycetaceae bacterium]|jgi:HEAT repeat protein|nr:HEAT repeat domain-containing protein [Planctomycetaceae bacterium]MBT6484827.1 HEAT repeat domain-containing protein [Planctomycetaceae bacterium]MBT6496719.1 HEAT repeat domain-containing protein [Planctomycetaceae bacterium]